jgi:hypothetical protein
MVSVLLLTVSMMTISVLVIRASNRELSQANASVARERALMAAQATVEFGAAQLRQEINQTNNAQQVINAALGGFNTPGDPSACMSIYDDCIPGGNGQPNISQSGQKNRAVTGKSDCSGRPCMRQGAIALLPDRQGVPANWVQIPLRDLLDGADAEARVTLWVRNNNGDAVNSDGAGSWLADSDGRVVLTAMATIRNTTVTVAQEYALTPGTSAQAWSMNTPDVGDGGGHNGDNVMAAVCIENFAGYEE